MSIWPIVFILAVIAFGAGLLGIRAYRTRHRRADCRQAAGDLGWEFAETGDALPGADHDRFHLFQLGRRGGATNILGGRIEDLDAVAFDWAYTVGSGKSARRCAQSVAALGFAGPALPSFALRPEQVLHRIGTLLGYQDLDFPAAPKFSDAFLLQGKDEEAVRALFTTEVTDWFEHHKGVSVEGHGNWIILYRRARLVAPSDLLGMTEEAMEVLARMMSHH